MTAAEFRRLARTAVGRGHGWQARIALRLGVDVRTVQRWLANDVAIPGPVEIAVTCLAGKATAA